MKKFLLSLCFVCVAMFCYAQGPVFQWAKQSHGYNSYSDHHRTSVLDAAGNIYSVGMFADTVDFDPGPAVFNLISNGYSDIFISKLDASGNFVWARQIGGNQADNGISVAVDNSGNVYVTGVFYDTVDFDPGAGVYKMISPLYPLPEDYFFLLKLDGSGNFLWAKQTMNTTISAGTVVATGPGDNLFTVDLSSLSKLNASGNLLWTKTFANTVEINAVAIDAQGNVVATGVFGPATADFDPGPGAYNLTSKGGRDVFAVKLDAVGDLVWVKSFGGGYSEDGFSIAVDVLSNVYLSGEFKTVVDFDPGPGTYNLTTIGTSGHDDIFIAKLDASGNFAWARNIGSNFMDRGYSVCVDQHGDVYATGMFQQTADFDPGPGTYNLTAAGIDAFIVKLNTNGKFVWATSFGGFSIDEGRTVSVDGLGNVYATGGFNGTVDFDPGAGVFNLSPSGTYTLKLSQSTTGVSEIQASSFFSICPNPGSGIFTLCISQPSKDASIEIYNTLGAMVCKQGDLKEANTIDLTNSANGIYFLRLMEKGQTVSTQKIVKQ